MPLITDSPDFDIRYSKPEDLPFLQKWISLPEVRRWYPVSTDQDVKDLTKNWIGFSRFGASLTADYKGEPVGIATLFLMPYRKLIHHSLLYIIVNPEHQGSGVGSSIVKNITHLGKSYFRFEKIHLDTYLGCPALSILKKAGYEEVLRQEHYVKEPDGNYLSRVIVEISFNEGT